MSVFRYPNVRSYWGEYAFGTIQNTMSRNRFEKIRGNLHFNDNSKLPSKDSTDHDPLYKIRPLVNHFNEKFQSVPMRQRLSVDEQMCATKMKTFLRQYLPDKPHKWGVKFFNLCDSSGFCYNFEIYCGAGDNVVQGRKLSFRLMMYVMIKSSIFQCFYHALTKKPVSFLVVHRKLKLSAANVI